MKQIQKLMLLSLIMLSQIVSAQESVKRQFKDDADSLDYFRVRRFYYSGMTGLTNEEVEQIKQGQMPTALKQSTVKTGTQNNQLRGPEPPEASMLASSINGEKQISPGTALTGEPTIAVNPANQNNFITAYHYNNGQMQVSTTYNGGVNWSDQLTFGPNYSSLSDPSLAFSPNGQVAYLSYIDFERVNDVPRRNRVVVRELFGNVTTVIEEYDPSTTTFHDKPFIASDVSASVYSGSIYVTWVEFSQNAKISRIRFAYRRVGQTSFTVLPNPISETKSTESTSSDQNPATLQAPYPVVKNDGTVYVFFRSKNKTDNLTIDLRYNYSTNGGQSFVNNSGSVSFQSNIKDTEGQVAGGKLLKTPTFPMATVNPINNEIYVVWSERSAQAGGTDLAIKKINANGTLGNKIPLAFGGADFQYSHPSITCNSQGKSFVSYYFVSTNSESTTYDVLFQTSRLKSDGSNGFSFTGISNFFSFPKTVSYFAGDYLGIAANNDTYWSVFSKNYQLPSQTNPNVRTTSIFASYYGALPTIQNSGLPAGFSSTIKLNGVAQSSPFTLTGTPLISGQNVTLRSNDNVTVNNVPYAVQWWEKDGTVIGSTQEITVPIQGSTYTAVFKPIVPVVVRNEFREANDVIRTFGGIVNVRNTDYNSDLTGGQVSLQLATLPTRFEAKQQEYQIQNAPQSYRRVFNTRTDRDGGWIFNNARLEGITPIITPTIESGTYTAKYRNDFKVFVGQQTEFDGTTQPAQPNYVTQYESSIITAPVSIPALNGRNYSFGFWSDNNSSDPNRSFSPTDNTSLTAVYKGHLLSSVSTATSSGGSQRRLVRDYYYADRYYQVYESSGKIWLEYTLDAMATWQKPILLGTGKNPAITTGGVGVHTVWLGSNVDNFGQTERTIQSRQMYITDLGINLHPVRNVSFYPSDSYVSINLRNTRFPEALTPTIDSKPVVANLAFGNNYGAGQLVVYEGYLGTTSQPDETILGTALQQADPNPLNHMGYGLWTQHNYIAASAIDGGNQVLSPSVDYYVPYTYSSLADNKIPIVWRRSDVNSQYSTSSALNYIEATRNGVTNQIQFPNTAIVITSGAYSTNSQNPTVAVDASFNKHIAWQAYDPVNSKSVVFYKILPANNSTATPATKFMGTYSLLTPSINWAKTGSSTSSVTLAFQTNSTIAYTSKAASSWSNWTSVSSAKAPNIISNGAKKFAFTTNSSAPYAIRFGTISTGGVAPPPPVDMSNGDGNGTETPSAVTSSNSGNSILAGEGETVLQTVERTSVSVSENENSYLNLELSEVGLNGSRSNLSYHEVGANTLADTVAITPKNVLKLLKSRAFTLHDSLTSISAKVEIKAKEINSLADGSPVKVFVELWDVTTNQSLVLSEQVTVSNSDSVGHYTYSVSIPTGNSGIRGHWAELRVRVLGLSTNGLTASALNTIEVIESNGSNAVLNSIGNTVQSKVLDGKPTSFGLLQNYPNPFNPSTSIRYQLANPSNVKLVVFDMLGREVATLVNEPKAAGYYEVNFNASRLSSGTYFYRLQAGSYVETKKMLLVK